MNTWLRSARHAVDGLIYLVKSERNARIHLVFALIVLIASIAFQVSALEAAAVIFAVIIVFVAEVTNSAIEKTLDIVTTEHHPTIKLIKDMCAGAVLVAAVGAVVIGLIVFLPHLVGLFT